MSKYLYLYRGPVEPMTEVTPEQTRAWNEWFGGLGSALVDGGAPFGTRTAVADDGSSPTPSDQNGYSVVEADSLEEARTLLKGHPFLTEGKGRFSVEIFELVPM
ncbi:MAG TPA: hypothetical protein VFC00_14185 [Micromonosporaceae bacterium]|nr:hypothetical protein [Micromonosporaceae bacterium]